ncbi:MAG: DUF2637 domain-containing protein [Pseudonocardiaceae bacterium]
MTRSPVWLAGLLVALGAGAATAHGLTEVALAAGTPTALAWLYPLITDGLALVAYATTARLTSHGRYYAWTVVVAAAGLSGLTQATYLAGGVHTAPPGLRFAIGAWPALAAATTAHLLHLLTTHPPPALTPPGATGHEAHTPPTRPVVQPLNSHVNAVTAVEHPVVRPLGPGAPAGAAPARHRAETIARDHAARTGSLPTVTDLMTHARVARGTAAAALKALREHPTAHPTAHPTGEPTPTTRTNQ